MKKLGLYLIQHHPRNNNFVLNLPDLNDIPEHGIIALEFMLVAISCLIMSIVSHTSGATI